MEQSQQGIGRVDRLSRWAIWIILAGALVLRMIAITCRGLIYDDAFSIFLSRASLANIVSGTAADTMPPLYYFLLHFWMMLSDSIGFIRFLNVILSLLTIGLVYLLATELFGKTAALWAAALAAVSPLQIYHAQDVRMYVLLAFTQTAYLLCFVKIIHAPSKRISWGWWAGLVLSGTAALYTHNLAGFLLILLNAYLLLRKEWKKLLQLLIAQAFIGVLAIPWLVQVPGQIAKVQTAFWTQRPGVVDVVQVLLQNHINMPASEWMLPVALIVALFTLIMVSLAVIRQGIHDKGVQLILWVVLGLPALLFGVSYLMRPVFLARGMVTASLMYNILVGWFISRPGSKRVEQGLGAVVILLAFVSLPGLYTFQSFPRSPIREAGQFLQQEVQPGDVIVHDNKLSLFPMVFEEPNLPQRFLQDAPGSFNDTYALASQQAIGLIPDPDLATAVGNADRVYYVVFELAEQEYQEMGKDRHPSLAWLSVHYPHEERFAFGDLYVYRFER